MILWPSNWGKHRIKQLKIEKSWNGLCKGLNIGIILQKSKLMDMKRRGIKIHNTCIDKLKMENNKLVT